MKAIYYSTNYDPHHHSQCVEVTLIATESGNTYRVTLHWDRFYSFQTTGQLAILKKEEFTPLLHLFHHDMRQLAAFDALEPSKRGELEGAGKVAAILKLQTNALVDLAVRITTGGKS